MSKTICAISTPNAVGGISVVRISGDDAIRVAKKAFKPANKNIDVEKMAGHTCVFGHIVCGDRVIDSGVLTVFIAPKSYNGENIAEISCHGGIFVTKEVLRVCLDNGAALAEAGEFTKRAFINGKMSLTQAEAVMDLISSEGRTALQSANLAHDGMLFKRIKNRCKEITTVLGELAAWVDYPEDDLPAVEDTALTKSIRESIDDLKGILEDYDNGMIYREGIDTAIVGRANVGKSSLMNMLLGFDRSIVTDVAGTTRDVIEESVRLGEITLKLSDTAGIRDTDDKVESVGVGLAKKRLESARLIIAVFDGSEELSDKDRELLENLKDKNALIIINKTDLDKKISEYDFSFLNKPVISISAKENTGKKDIENAVYEIFKCDKTNSNQTVFVNERQRQCTAKALEYLSLADNAMILGDTLDAVTVTLSKALECLLELTGEKATETVVDEVFSKFCVGK